MLKGAMHIHSTYSDGEFSLRELRETLVSDGCSFACMSDHAESFDVNKLKDYVAECASLSGRDFCFVAGLEYACRGRMHVLGYGVAAPAATEDPEAVFRHIECEGGISVIAHPQDAAFGLIESLVRLPDGIEVWNSKSDGRYALRPGTIALLRRLQLLNPAMRAFYGQDLHWKKQFRGLFNIVRCEVPSREEILRALARGDYFATKADLQLPSTGEIPEWLLGQFALAHRRSVRLREWLKGGKRLMDRLGMPVPASIKAQVRRIF